MAAIKKAFVSITKFTDKELNKLGNFRDKKKLFLVRCPACEKENYLPAVATGICSWCGWRE